MTLIEEISNWISGRTTIPIEYAKLAVTTIAILLIASIVKKVLELIYRQFVKDPKKRFIYNQKKNVVVTIFMFACCLIVWNTHVAEPFNLEDRIEINGMRGDVVKISSLSFEMLELGERVNGEQSTGRIIHIPNSLIFTYALKNYHTAFQYIWNEIVVRVPLDADIDQVANGKCQPRLYYLL